mgnify:CR=1 FL=1
MSGNNATIAASSPAMPAPLALSTGAVEAIKWFALVVMVLDHANKYLYAALPFAFELGRLALPLFSFALAYNLARPGVIEGEAGRRVIVRLALFGAAATPAYMALGKLSWGWWPLNVMALFLVAAVVLRLVVQGGTTRRAMAAIVFVVAGSVVEFWWFGLGTIGAAWRYCKAPTWKNAAILAAALATLGLVNGNQWALAALPVAALIARIKVEIPRTGRFFYWFYPLHLSAIVVLTIIPITFTS